VPLRPWATATKGGYGAIDDARVGIYNRLIADPQSLGYTGPEGLQKNVSIPS